MRQFIRSDTVNLLPVIFWVKQPILLLIVLWLRLENRHVNNIENAGITPVLVLPLPLRHFLTVPVAYGANPIPTPPIVLNFLASYTAAAQLAGVGEAYDALGSLGSHNFSPARMIRAYSIIGPIDTTPPVAFTVACQTFSSAWRKSASA